MVQTYIAAFLGALTAVVLVAVGLYCYIDYLDKQDGCKD